MARDEQQRREMGARIKELRKSGGLKQQYIADFCGVQLRTYQLWQAGDTEPGQENLEKLAELFGVTPRFILRGATPDLSAAPDAPPPPDLAAMQEQLDRIERDLHLLVALLSGDEQAHGDLGAQILKTVERGLTRQAREAMRQPTRHSRGLPPESPQAVGAA